MSLPPRRLPMATTISTLIIGLGLALSGLAAADYAAVTTADPQIPTEELTVVVVPLTQDELVVEADAWLALVKEKAHAVAELELVNKKIKAQQEETTAPPIAIEAEGSGTSAPPAQPNGSRAALLEQLNAVRDERVGLIDRANIVLAELEDKGGDAEPYRTYLTAVSGIAIDVSDSEAVAATIKGWLYSEEGGQRWARNLVMFIVTVLAFWILSLILGRVVYRLLSASRNITTLLREFATKSVRRTVFIVGIIVGLSALEVDIGPLLAVVGAAGFVVAFALQGTLGNFASGIMILAYRPFDVDDVVQVAGVTGTVKDLNLVSVKINTPDNQIVVVPNNAVWGNVITNITGSPIRRVDMVFGIGYGDDMRKAQKILEGIVNDHPLTLGEPAPVVRVNELADSSVNFVCRPWTNTADYWAVYWDITQRVKEEFDAQGISIPFPQQDIHIQHLPEIRQG